MKSLVNWTNPERTVLFTDTGEAITYGNLKKKVLLNSKFFDKKDLLFIIGRNDFITLTIYLAAFEAGAVPLLLSAEFPESSLISLVKTYCPSKVFLPKEKYKSIVGLKIEKEFNDYFICTNQICANPDLNPKLALLLTTSGSTGAPKLVRFSAENIVSNTNSIISYLSINCTDCAVTTLPFNYSYGMSVINSHLRAGASIFLTNRSFFDPEFWKLMKSCGVTSLSGVPYSYEMLMKLGFERMNLPNLRTLTQAGGKMAPDLTKQVIKLCKTKGIRFYMMYGQTEASPRMAYLSAEFLRQKLGSIGQPIPGGRFWLEDEQGKLISEVDQIGELVYSGLNVALGYAEKKLDLINGDDWNGVLRTGDLARKDAQGFFFIEGRKSRFLKIFGVRIALDSVELWLQQKGLTAVAYGRDDLLMVTIEELKEKELVVLIKDLSEAMQIHTSAIKINVLPQLPRLSSGKVDYHCLINHH